MNYAILNRLKKKTYFTVEDLVGLLVIRQESARVLCSRYVKKGLFIRLKNNFYVLRDGWEGFSNEDFLKVSNHLQVPSYTSFMTALSLYEVTTQITRDFFESACLKRSIRFQAAGVVFNYYKLKKEYYFDFVKKGDIFIATKEKALVDSIYLSTFGKYKIDFNSLDFEKFDKRRIKKILKVFPPRTKEMVKKICKI